MLFVIAACLGMLLATSCSNRKPLTMHYSAPSVAPVREKLSDAQSLSVAEATTGVAAQLALARAKTLAPQVPDLQEAIAEASGQVEHLLEVNANLQAALKEVGAKLAVYETATNLQTTLLNSANDAKNSAITERDIAVAKYHRLKFLVCLLAAGAVLSLAWRFKTLLLFIPPPYDLVAIGALPVIAFAFCWIAEPWEWLPFL
ncbi:MAG: hypothetical protein E6G94_01425 [Alphaproteobacteria bacterium]|nr:MAG: hypothetical protein E6G94_01425 [Alphaproteobacteria bacterium]